MLEISNWFTNLIDFQYFQPITVFATKVTLYDDLYTTWFYGSIPATAFDKK
jgi:hypothetical protein